VVTASDPPPHLVTRSEDVGFPTQSANQLEHVIEERDGGRRAWVRYVHSGIFTDDWDNQYDGANRHTDFYLHTLREYLTHFAPRAVSFAQLNGPEASQAPDAFTAVAGGGAARGERGDPGPRPAVPGGRGARGGHGGHPGARRAVP
ncbi:hypothetical protein ACFV23_46200, partial [Streptomyces sp. NPDC059627]